MVEFYEVYLLTLFIIFINSIILFIWSTSEISNVINDIEESKFLPENNKELTIKSLEREKFKCLLIIVTSLINFVFIILLVYNFFYTRHNYVAFVLFIIFSILNLFSMLMIEITDFSNGMILDKYSSRNIYTLTSSILCIIAMSIMIIYVRNMQFYIPYNTSQ